MLTSSNPRRGPRWGLLAFSLLGLGVIAAAAPSGCRDRAEGAIVGQAGPDAHAAAAPKNVSAR